MMGGWAEGADTCTCSCECHSCSPQQLAFLLYWAELHQTADTAKWIIKMSLLNPQQSLLSLDVVVTERLQDSPGLHSQSEYRADLPGSSPRPAEMLLSSNCNSICVGAEWAFCVLMHDFGPKRHGGAAEPPVHLPRFWRATGAVGVD